MFTVYSFLESYNNHNAITPLERTEQGYIGVCKCEMSRGLDTVILDRGLPK